MPISKPICLTSVSSRCRTTIMDRRLKDQFPEWRDAILKADGLVVSFTPNTTMVIPAIESCVDLLLKEYIHKAVALVGVSAGPWGGTR